jgi:hypothetical protein
MIETIDPDDNSAALRASIYLTLLLALLLGTSTAKAAEEHCLVVQAIAVAAYDARMQLLVGTDPIFTSAFYERQAATKKVREKYNALIAARNKKGSMDNPENQLRSFGSPAERKEYFDKWDVDIKLLEADLNGELTVYDNAFDQAMKADTNQNTRGRLARILAMWNKEYYAPCYWGQPK